MAKPIHPISNRRFPRSVIMAALACLVLPLTAAHGQSTPPPNKDEGAEARSGDKPNVAVLSVHDMLTDVTVESLKRRIEHAKARGAKVIVLDMDTPGGLVTSSIAIADLMRELTDIKTVAWVNPNAHSGGSIVAVACDEIIMTRSSRIGDSQVILGGPAGAEAIPEELQPKAYTPVLADFRTSCRLHGYSQVLCEAFVLPEREVWWLEQVETGERKFVFRDEKVELMGEKDEDSKPADEDNTEAADVDDASTEPEEPTKEPTPPSAPPQWKLVKTYHDPVLDAEVDTIQPIVRDDQLLEMSAGEAYAYGFCKEIVSNESGVIARYGAAELFRLDANWSELLAFWLTSMYVRGFLLLVIFLAAYVEFHTPGVGVAGLVALIALAIFVGAPYLTGLANIWEILLIVLGVILLGLELFVIPGFGIAGISGLAFVLVGLVATFVPDEPGRWFPLFAPDLQGTIEWVQRGLATVVGAMGISLVGMFLLSKYLPKTPVFQRIVPANPTPSEVMVEDPYRGAARVGDIGLTQGPLHPAGKAVFDNVLVDVVTRGEYLDADARVEVIERHGNRVVVRAVT
jgi:membrane-bound serine protease (ClpP class)